MINHHVDATASSAELLSRSIWGVRPTAPNHELWSGVISYLQARARSHSSNSVARRLVHFITEQKEAELQLSFTPSFTSFLASSPHKSPFTLIVDAHQELAATYLDIMAAELRFNICRFPSSFMRNTHVPSLLDLADAKISPQLRYACRYWTHHVAQLVTLDGLMLKRMIEFFRSHLLSWLEVMSIFGLSSAEMLQNLSPALVRISFVATVLNETNHPSLSDSSTPCGTRSYDQ